MPRPNILVIISDTLRASHLGCYGNRRIQTPNIDALARRAVRFTRAYPESLPTIPVRRAMHTGRRAFPFRGYRPVPWDIVYLPGWQAMSAEEDTLAESLAGAGYHTGFITDTLPYFAPGFNFARGFWQWDYVRGQQQDRWKSPYAVPRERYLRYGDPDQLSREPHGFMPMFLANTSGVQDESDTSTARVFSHAMQFLEDNQAGQPFYLLVDCFDPHEPWEAPEKYYRLYGDPDYAGERIVHCKYGSADQFGYGEREIAFVEAQYCGLVTLVDTWMGKLLDQLQALGLDENTWVFMISDHGTNFTRNPRRIIGKPDHAMYPGVMRLPLLVQAPDGQGRGTVRDELVANIDVPATVYDLAGIQSGMGLDGRSLRPLISGESGWTPRDYITCRYNHSLAYIDDRSWVLTDVDARPQEAFDLEADPTCQRNIMAKAGERFDLAWERLLYDAGGEFPDYRSKRQTDAIGQRIETPR